MPRAYRYSLTLPESPGGRYYHYPHFTEAETKVPRAEATCLSAMVTQGITDKASFRPGSSNLCR